jgi:transcriptional regulator with XRE-family HTH domain
MPLGTSLDWTPPLIKQLRGRRTQSEFGKLLGVPKNTVWRWESNYSRPLGRFSAKMAKLAETEGFLKNFKLVGSVTILGDLEEGSREIAALFPQSPNDKRGRRRAG